MTEYELRTIAIRICEESRALAAYALRSRTAYCADKAQAEADALWRGAVALLKNARELGIIH